MVDGWAEVVGQERAAAELRASAATPVHAYLLVGPEGWGAWPLARAFAADVLATGLDGDDADRVRRLVIEGNHADVLTVAKEGNQLRKEEVAELIRFAYRHPTERPYKVLIVPDFDDAGDKAWAQMLKVLEEPPPSTIWILFADRVPIEMATIASRSAIVELDPVPPSLVAARLVAEGAEPGAAATAADACGGDVDLARLLVGDERLALRVAAWREVPGRLDGTGHAVWRLVGELRAAIDDALAHVKSRFDAAEAELAVRVEELGLPKGRLRELADSHKRQLRRARTAEIRLGLSTVGARYRDGLVDPRLARRRRELCAAVDAIDVAYEAFFRRNANETLQLQALFLRLPALT